MAVLSKVINTIQVADVNGNLNSDEFPIGALASNVAFGGLQSNESVEDKLNHYDAFIRDLSTNDVKYTKNEVTQTLTEYLEKNITTDNKSTGIVEQEENDDSAYVTAKGVIDYLAKKTNTEIKSTTEVANNNLVSDNAVYKYVQKVLPTAAQNFDEAENSKYVTVELFNSKYIPMFEGDLTDEVVTSEYVISPGQVVKYVKNKTATGAIEENSSLLVTSGTIYSKLAEMNVPNKSLGITSFTEDDETYVTPLQVKNYVKLVTPVLFSETSEEGGVVSYNITDNTKDESSYISPNQAINYVLSKYVGEVTENEESGETPFSRTITLKNLTDLTEEDELYTKGFVTPKQVVDYVALQSHNIDTALRNYIGITGTVAETGNLLPDMGEGVTILSRLAALEEAVKLNTATTN